MKPAFQPVASRRLEAVATSRSLALRTHPLVFGVVVFLASELMFFGSLIAAYFSLRASAETWPPPGSTLDTAESVVGTAMLALSSATMMLCTHYGARVSITVARLWLGTTILLGTGFALIAVHGWVHAPFRIGSHAYGTLFFTLTGFHLLHVVAGIVILGILFASMRMSAFQRDARAGVEAIGFYWHS